MEITCKKCQEVFEASTGHRKFCKSCISIKRAGVNKANKQRAKIAALEGLTLGGESLLKSRYKQYIQGAKSRNKEFNLSLDEFELFWKKPCHYCGESINTIGLDRYDNSQGYISNNIVSCCNTCNFMKRTLHGDTFIELCRKISNYI